MEDKKLENKLLDSLKTFTDDFGSIKEQCVNDASEGIKNIDDENKRAFLQESLDKALSGDLTADEFLKNIKINL